MNGSTESAPLGWRFIASMADLILVVVPALLIGRFAPGGPGTRIVLGVGTAVAVVLVQLVLQARQGWTVGQWAVGLRLVDHETGRPVGMDRAMLRALLVALGLLVFVVGGLVVLASPWFDKSGRRRGWHDELIDADVIYLSDGRTADRPKLAAARSASAGPEVAPAAPVVGVQPGGEDAPVLAFGLMPELERTRRSGARTDVAWDDEETYRPMTADLELSDGSVHEVQGVVLVGRNPIAGPGQTGLRLADRERSVSRTHLRLTVGPIAVWVEDLGTVNGTVVHLPDATEEACEPGRLVQLPVGSVIGVGDAWIRLSAVSGEPVFPERTTKR